MIIFDKQRNILIPIKMPCVFIYEWILIHYSFIVGLYNPFIIKTYKNVTAAVILSWKYMKM